MRLRPPITAVLALLGGCAAVPTVVYHQVAPGVRGDTWVPFRLTDSIVVIGAPGAAHGDDSAAPPVDLAHHVVYCPREGCGPVAAAAVPTDDTTLYALEPHTRRFVSTTAAPAYYSNSLRLKTLTIEAKDHRLEAINAIATIAGTAAKAASGNLSNFDRTAGVPQLNLPITIPRCADFACPTAAPLPGNPGWTYAVTYRDTPAAAGLLPRSQLTMVRAAMVVSACRPAHIVLTAAAEGTLPGGTAARVELDVAVADPDWLVTVPFPAKGAMTFHTLCGIDVQAQPVTDIGVDAMAAAFANGVRQIANPK